MAVTITRKTGWIGMAGAITVQVDGEKVARVNDNETIRVELPADEATLRVTQFGSRSNKLRVMDGDTIVIRMPLGYKLLYCLLIFMPLFTTLFLSHFETRFLLALILLFGTVLLLLEAFQLQNVHV